MIDKLQNVFLDKDILSETTLTNKVNLMHKFYIYKELTLTDIININILLHRCEDKQFMTDSKKFVEAYQMHGLIKASGDKIELTSFSLNAIIDYVLRLNIMTTGNKPNKKKPFKLQFRSSIKNYLNDIINGYGTPYLCEVVARLIGLPIFTPDYKLNSLGLNIYYSIFADFDEGKMLLIRDMYSKGGADFIKFVSNMRFFWSEQEIEENKISVPLFIEFMKNGLIETFRDNNTEYYRLSREAQCVINMRNIGPKLNYWQNEFTKYGYLFLY